MPMTANGMAKLHEEIGELLQVTGKKLAYFHAAEHPDGAGPLDERLRREMADVYAALDFSQSEFGLDGEDVAGRRAAKLTVFGNSARLPMTACGIAMLHQKMGALLSVTAFLFDGFMVLEEAPVDRLMGQRDRVTQAVADLYAALDYVSERLSLDREVIDARRSAKLQLFRQWHADASNGSACFHAASPATLAA